MKRTILAAVVAVAALAPSAQAQLMNPVKFGVSGGVSIPTSDAFDESVNGGPRAKLNTGYNVAGHLGFQLPIFPLGLRADVSYNDFGGKEQRFDFGFGTGQGQSDVNVFSGTLNAVIQPTSMIVAKPYFIGGIGAYRVNMKTQASADFGDGLVTESDTESSTNFGLNGGAGVRFGLAGFSTFLEARYHYVFNKESCGPDDECLNRKATSFVPISFGIMF